MMYKQGGMPGQREEGLSQAAIDKQVQHTLWPDKPRDHFIFREFRVWRDSLYIENNVRK
jgi:hypothetical protein